MAVYSLPITNSNVWCMSVQQPGVILQGIDYWKQQCYVVLNTPLGSDPLRPMFGCDWAKQVDGGSLIAAASIKQQIINALTIWVPEVTVGKITYTISAGKVVFNISLSVAGQSIVLPLAA